MTTTQNFGEQSENWPQQPGSAHQPQQAHYAPQPFYGAAPETPHAVNGPQSQMPYEPQSSSAAEYQTPYAPQTSYPAQPPAQYAPQPVYNTEPQQQYAPQPAYNTEPQQQYAPQPAYAAQPQMQYAPQAAYAAQPQMPYLPNAQYGAAPAGPGGPEKKVKLGKLAWAGLILGIVGVLGSLVPILGYVTMFGAIVGGILSAIAFFGSRKILSAIGVALCILGVVLTVAVGNAFAKSVDDSLSTKAVSTDARASSPGKSDATKNVYKFGQTIKFSDGSTLRVEKPVKFTPDEYAITGEKKPLYLKFKATFVNKTKEIYDPSLTTASASAGGEESESVYQDGLGTPDNKVLPGKSVSWSMGYGVRSQKDLQLQVSVGFMDYDTVVFTN